MVLLRDNSLEIEKNGVEGRRETKLRQKLTLISVSLNVPDRHKDLT